MTGGCRRPAGERRDGELRGGAHGCHASIRARQRGTREGLVLGFAFKENVADVRNTRVADIVHALQSRGAQCSIFDPEADAVGRGGPSRL